MVSFSGLSEDVTEAKMVHVPTGYGQVLLEAGEDTSPFMSSLTGSCKVGRGLASQKKLKPER